MSLLPNVGLVVLGVLGITLVLSIVWLIHSQFYCSRTRQPRFSARCNHIHFRRWHRWYWRFSLAVGALVGQHSVEEFAKAKEILTVLIGVFGTILGFYFGTAAGGGQKLDVAEN